MSREKVEKYREYKKNRKAHIAKEKRHELFGRVAAWAIIFVIVLIMAVGVGLSVRNHMRQEAAKRPDYKTTSFILTDYSGITVPTTEANQ